MKIRVGLTIALVTLAVIAGIAGAAWWWWDASWTELKEGSEAVMDRGRKDGAALTESGCLAKAVARHCTAWGFTDYYCPHVAGQIPEYCGSAKRAPSQKP